MRFFNHQIKHLVRKRQCQTRGNISRHKRAHYRQLARLHGGKHKIGHIHRQKTRNCQCHQPAHKRKHFAHQPAHGRKHDAEEDGAECEEVKSGHGDALRLLGRLFRGYFCSSTMPPKPRAFNLPAAISASDLLGKEPVFKR